MIALVYLMHYIILFLAHICLYTLDNAELESEVQAKQAEAKDFSNLDLNPGKPGVFNHAPCLLI
jgi:hypothetical protein